MRLRDVFAISTGAMISSGFFLLPGLATAEAGPSVVLAYFAAGLLVLPALFSKAELSTAMPKAGGTYYFLDRSLGPLVGTVGGLGIWFALVLKSAFALIGVGAYLGLFVDVSIRPVAIGLTLAFGAFNTVGVKQTTRLQQGLVYFLLVVLGFFIAQGLVEIGVLGVGEVIEVQFTPFFPFGFEGLATTTGLVFVSYAGLTKIASVAEEVQNPDYNIPRGMLLSLIVATTIYVLGVAIMVAVLDPVELRSDLTPVATAGEAFFDWLPAPIGLVLIMAAAFAAFASTGNAGILSASRYPLAMARDGLVASGLSKVGRFGTPTRSIVLTVGATVLVLALLDVKSVAKLASAFQLLIFSLINLSVIVMRESRLPSYSPGYRSPFYPWTQIAGILIPLWLVWVLGILSIVFTVGIIVIGLAWYYFYSRGKVAREGAIYHVFERLGRRRYEGLEPELRQIIKEKTLGGSAPFEEAVAGGLVVDLDDDVQSFEDVTRRASDRLAELVGAPADELYEAFVEETRLDLTPISGGCALPHLRRSDVSEPHLLMLRSRVGVPSADGPIHAFFFLVSPRSATGPHLQILAQIAAHANRSDFLERWRAARTLTELKEILLHEDQFLTIRIRDHGPTAELGGMMIRDIGFPSGALLVLIERASTAIVPHADTVLAVDDRLTFLGEPEVVRDVRRRFSG
ncbi:MAG TPA: amino acid permease [Gemmatimonadota bacterium]|nr:amino acid permease [Gemmatimonadota bacterium]